VSGQGLSELSATDIWPLELAERLRERQIDGVLVVELTQLKGWAPISLGVKGRLVSADGTTYWSADELFDMSLPAVYAAARQYERGMLLQVGKIKSSSNIEISPAKLAKYVGYTLFDTLPTPPPAR
jgi:hypothetical protein